MNQRPDRITAAYVRVSTDEQAEHGTGLDVQIAECERRARELGIGPVHTYVDAGVSGTTLDRPGLTALRRDIAQGRIVRVLCYDPDRLARNLGHLLLLMDEWAQAGVPVEFTNFDLHPTADGRLLFALRGAIAEFETHKIRQRMTAGKLARAREGKPVGGGHLIYGYRYDKTAKAFLPDPEEAPVVRLMFRLAEEHGTWEIAKDLNARGIRAKRGGPWSQTSVLGILRNPTYLGRMPQMRGVGHVSVPPLVDPATFGQVQRRLAARHNRPPGPARHPYLLRGFLHCAACGRALGGGYGHRIGTGYIPRYACAGKRRRPPCPSPYLRADRVDTAVWQHVLQSVLSPTAILDAAEHVARTLAECHRDAAERDAVSRRTDPEAQLAALDLRKSRLIRAYRDGILDEATLQAELTELAEARALVEADTARSVRDGQGDLRTWCREETAALVRYLRGNPSLEDRRLVLASLDTIVRVHPGSPPRIVVELAPGDLV